MESGTPAPVCAAVRGAQLRRWAVGIQRRSGCGPLQEEIFVGLILVLGDMDHGVDRVTSKNLKA
jgi:hypothetical protein